MNKDDFKWVQVRGDDLFTWKAYGNLLDANVSHTKRHIDTHVFFAESRSEPMPLNKTLYRHDFDYHLPIKDTDFQKNLLVQLDLKNSKLPLVLDKSKKRSSGAYRRESCNAIYPYNDTGTAYLFDSGSYPNKALNIAKEFAPGHDSVGGVFIHGEYTNLMYDSQTNAFTGSSVKFKHLGDAPLNEIDTNIAVKGDDTGFDQTGDEAYNNALMPSYTLVFDNIVDSISKDEEGTFTLKVPANNRNSVRQGDRTSRIYLSMLLEISDEKIEWTLEYAPSGSNYNVRMLNKFSNNYTQNTAIPSYVTNDNTDVPSDYNLDCEYLYMGRGRRVIIFSHIQPATQKNEEISFTLKFRPKKVATNVLGETPSKVTVNLKGFQLHNEHGYYPASLTKDTVASSSYELTLSEKFRVTSRDNFKMQANINFHRFNGDLITVMPVNNSNYVGTTVKARPIKVRADKDGDLFVDLPVYCRKTNKEIVHTLEYKKPEYANKLNRWTMVFEIIADGDTKSWPYKALIRFGNLEGEPGYLSPVNTPKGGKPVVELSTPDEFSGAEYDKVIFTAGENSCYLLEQFKIYTGDTEIR